MLRVAAETQGAEEASSGELLLMGQLDKAKQNKTPSS